MLDLVAYHNLLGADCFIFVIDVNNSQSSAAKTVLARLGRQPSMVTFVQFVDDFVGRALGHAMEQYTLDLLAYLQTNAVTVEFYSYLDVDEALAIPGLTANGWRAQPARGAPSASKGDPQPISIIPFLRRALTQANGDAIYLERLTFRSAGFRALKAAQLRERSK